MNFTKSRSSKTFSNRLFFLFLEDGYSKFFHSGGWENRTRKGPIYLPKSAICPSENNLPLQWHQGKSFCGVSNLLHSKFVIVFQWVLSGQGGVPETQRPIVRMCIEAQGLRMDKRNLTEREQTKKLSQKLADIGLGAWVIDLVRWQLCLTLHCSHLAPGLKRIHGPGECWMAGCTNGWGVAMNGWMGVPLSVCLVVGSAPMILGSLSAGRRLFSCEHWRSFAGFVGVVSVFFACVEWCN